MNWGQLNPNREGKLLKITSEFRVLVIQFKFSHS